MKKLARAVIILTIAFSVFVVAPASSQDDTQAKTQLRAAEISLDKSQEIASWSKLHQTGIGLLKMGDSQAAEKALSRAVEKSSSFDPDDSFRNEALTNLALVYVEKAVDKEVIEQERLNNSKRDLLYMVLILIVAFWLVSFLVKHGPQRPKFVDACQKWAANNLSKPETGAAEQLTSSFFSIMIFLLVAIAMIAFLFCFMWVVAAVGPPVDGQYQVSKVEFEKAKSLLSKTGASSKALSKIEILKAYRDFLQGTGRNKRVATVQEKIVLLSRAGVND